MSDFSADWLALREPADRRARDAGLLRELGSYFAGRERIAVTDIGCGTGAAMRALAALLPAHQTWRLVDRDGALLTAVTAPTRPALPEPHRLQWHPHCVDLQQAIDQVIALPADLIVTSAVLDLMSAEWLTRLVDALAAARRPIYAALSYDGRTICRPFDAFDASVLEAFNAHQRADKGFGPMPGPDAAATVAARLRARGYVVRQAASDWQVGPEESELQRALVQGWHAAVLELGTLDRQDLDLWHARRRTAIDSGGAHVMVGHTDVWAHPP